MKFNELIENVAKDDAFLTKSENRIYRDLFVTNVYTFYETAKKYYPDLKIHVEMEDLVQENHYGPNYYTADVVFHNDKVSTPFYSLHIDGRQKGIIADQLQLHQQLILSECEVHLDEIISALNKKEDTQVYTYADPPFVGAKYMLDAFSSLPYLCNTMVDVIRCNSQTVLEKNHSPQIQELQNDREQIILNMAETLSPLTADTQPLFGNIQDLHTNTSTQQKY